MFRGLKIRRQFSAETTQIKLIYLHDVSEARTVGSSYPGVLLTCFTIMQPMMAIAFCGYSTVWKSGLAAECSLQTWPHNNVYNTGLKKLTNLAHPQYDYGHSKSDLVQTKIIW